jgi:S-methylmethionine-dependent homocysteine/selenocysteine methylase
MYWYRLNFVFVGVLSKRFLERLRSGPPLLLDAAMGTELQRRDARTTLPLWSAQTLIDDPELVWTVHADEVSAGADIITTNTFRTHARSLGKAGLEERAAELSVMAVRLAHQAASTPGREVFVAGSLSPLEDCYRPDLVPGEDALEREHAAQATLLAEAGVDLLLAETHNTIREAVAVTRAAKATGLPVLISLVTDGAGRLLSGERIEEAAAALDPLAPDALGINCVPAARLEGDLVRLAGAVPGRPLLAYGNLGLPAEGAGWTFSEELEPGAYSDLVTRWLAAGARIVGGCCGTTPAHTGGLRALLDAAAAQARDDSERASVSIS